MSEKMDGIRAYWNGSQLISRNNRIIQCPKWFTEGWTDTPLDGELWIGRSRSFQDIVKISGQDESAWEEVGYYVFDLPSSTATYEDRMKIFQDMKSSFPSHVSVVDNVQCNGEDHLKKYLENIL